VYQGLLDRSRAAGIDLGSNDLMFAVLNIHFGNLDVAEREIQAFMGRIRPLKNMRGLGHATCHLAHLHAIQDRASVQYFCDGLKMLQSVNEIGAVAEFLVLASKVFLPSRAATAAATQGFAARLIEESGTVPDRLLNQWGSQVCAETRSLIPDRYDAASKDGRTMSFEEVFIELEAGPDKCYCPSL
jgi:hypothetical protein